MPTLADVASLAQPPNASGAGMGERDLPAVPEARHGLQRDRGALLRVVLPPDPEVLRLWLHRFKPAAYDR